MHGLDVTLVPMLSDNYAYLLRDRSTGAVGVVDPAEAAPVLALLPEMGNRLDLILITHHHGDHIGGVQELVERTGCKVVGPAADRHRLPKLDRLLAEGDSVALGDQSAKVIATPGHTNGHISYWFEKASDLFCGDTLFVMGCGRLLEGDAPTMWQSLGKLASLPDGTRIYCGHEYTLTNARFALTVEPGNDALKQRLVAVTAIRERGEPTIPSTLAEEKATNPFLRARDVTEFAERRRRKDVA